MYGSLFKLFIDLFTYLVECDFKYEQIITL